MRAIVITKAGGPEVMELREVATPDPGPGQVRVRVRATAVNRADILQCMGLYPAPADSPADIPGLEYAGEIDAVGDGVKAWTVGDRVFGLVGGGSYAEALVTHERTVAAIPTGLSFTDAAAIPEAFITAYDAMVTQGGLCAGETVLINAVASGVGTAAVQIARAIGARSVGTTRTEAKLDKVRALGLTWGVVPGDDGFVNGVKATSGSVDLVLELVGGDYIDQDVKCLSRTGRIVLVGVMGGVHTKINLGALLGKRIRLFGTVLRSRPLEEKIAAAQMFARNIVPLVEDGALQPVVDRVMPLTDIAEAHTYVKSNKLVGKVVLTVD